MSSSLGLYGATDARLRGRGAAGIAPVMLNHSDAPIAGNSEDDEQSKCSPHSACYGEHLHYDDDVDFEVTVDNSLDVILNDNFMDKPCTVGLWPTATD